MKLKCLGVRYQFMFSLLLLLDEKSKKKKKERKITLYFISK